jgi:hypothetical protein
MLLININLPQKWKQNLSSYDGYLHVYIWCQRFCVVHFTVLHSADGRMTGEWQIRKDLDELNRVFCLEVLEKPAKIL